MRQPIIAALRKGVFHDWFLRERATLFNFAETLGQQIVIEQRPGAGGVIGADTAAKAAPDGYTLVIGQASNLAINPNLMKKLPYDPIKDFSPITLISASPNLLVVHPSLPVHSIEDLVAELLPRDNLLPRAWELAEQLAKKSDVLLRNTRMVLVHPLKKMIDEGLQYFLAMETLAAVDRR